MVCIETTFERGSVYEKAFTQYFARTCSTRRRSADGFGFNFGSIFIYIFLGFSR